MVGGVEGTATGNTEEGAGVIGVSSLTSQGLTLGPAVVEPTATVHNRNLTHRRAVRGIGRSTRTPQARMAHSLRRATHRPLDRRLATRTPPRLPRMLRRHLGGGSLIRETFLDR